MTVEENLRRLLEEKARELGRLDWENEDLRRRLARAEEAVAELRAMVERAHT